jgi:isoquinoline 1-oxidoreductase beta subunit
MNTKDLKAAPARPRRRLVLQLGAAAGALVVGWSVLPARSRLGSRELLQGEGATGLNGWIRVEADGRVGLVMPRSEMGQGVHHTLALLAAEEMDLRPDQIVLLPAAPLSLYGNVAVLTASLPVTPRDDEPGARPLWVRGSRWMLGKVARELGIHMTGGSASIADAWEPVRLAAATARAQLLGAAALQWRLPVDELEVREGVVRHASGVSAPYLDLVRAAAGLPPGDVRLKAPSQWRLLGKPVPRRDLPPKVDGRAGFGIDARPPGLLFASLRMSPFLEGVPGRLANADAVRQRPGVLRLSTLRPVGGAPGAVAVVARSSWHAREAARALEIDWPLPPRVRHAGELPDSARIAADLAGRARAALDHDGGFAFVDQGRPAAEESAARDRSARVVEALYEAPYLAHMTLEPPNATAQWHAGEGRLELWAPTQVPDLALQAAARALGIDPARVTLHVTLLGGGFGRRLEVDVVVQAALLALECGGAPVQLLWPREEDLAHDVYRPAGACALRATLTADGGLHSLRVASAGDAVTPRWAQRNAPLLATPVDTPDKTTVEGLFDHPYAVAHQRIAHVATRSGVPVGFWRSVGHSHNAFFMEGFIDEVAAAAGQDPVAWRLARLDGLPRHAAVLRLVADRAGWSVPLAADPAGPRARGVALHESFGSIVAAVLELQWRRDEASPRVTRVVLAADVGTVLQPDGVRQQLEGSVIFALGAALRHGITVREGAVTARNLPDQPLPRLAECPRIETHLVPSTAEPTGIGEPGVPVIAPALASALAALSGRRLRRLPLDLASLPRPA